MQAGSSTSAAGAGGPRPVVQSEAGREKKDLASWWRNFVRTDRRAQEQASPQGIFGVPLQVSILYANVAISLFNEEGQSYVYGYVPIIVAKCGVFLKEKATDVEGIFRLAGSEKRIKDLMVAFDSPDRYGKGLDWTGFTVHDAANILRRYFNQLPEPIIPLGFYEDFRAPLKTQQAQTAAPAKDGPNATGIEMNIEAAIRTYQRLITGLPPLNRQLLLYILDLLAVFASKSDLNKMTTPNLAAIFQPGILSHPQHDMAPREYRLSQSVLIFLIENQDSFLIGMQGTAADAETVREVQSGSPAKPSTPPTPTRSKTVSRSESNSSAAADSIRRFGSIRRNLSVSSKTSKRSEVGPTPVVSSPGTPPSGGSGVHRSNTVPSRRGPLGTHSPRFATDRTFEQATPAAVAPATVTPTTVTPNGPVSVANHDPTPASPVQATPTPSTTTGVFKEATPSDVKSTTSSEATARIAVVPGSDASSVATRDYQTPRKDTTPLLGAQASAADRSVERSSPNASAAAAGRKNFLDILKQSPTSDGEGRRPNKLQKKRIPGSSLSSAQSSSHSLTDGPNDLSERSPVSPDLAPMHPRMEKIAETSSTPSSQHTPVAPSPQRNPTDATLRPTVSPAHSYHSQTDLSDADLVGDDMPAQSNDDTDRPKRRSRWRFSRSQSKVDPVGGQPGNPLGTMNTKELATSRSTIGSGGSYSRPSFQEHTPIAEVTSTDSPVLAPIATQSSVAAATSPTDQPVFSDSERERRGGPMSWLRGKIQERRDNKDGERRSMTPERSHERSQSKQDVAAPASPPPKRSTGAVVDDVVDPASKSPVKPAPLSNASPAIASPSAAVAAADLPPPAAPLVVPVQPAVPPASSTIATSTDKVLETPET